MPLKIKIKKEVVVILQQGTKNVKQENCQSAKFEKKIGSTNYVVSVRFNEKSKESFDDKLFRVIRNEVRNIA